MTVIYVPRLIESAEQAEALPEGAIMFLSAGPYVWTARDPGGEFLDHYGRPWHFENTQDDEPFTALVPIEAEEEWAAEFESGEMYVNLDEDSARAADGGAAMSRLVTPWEAV